ncbi:TetR/AcrR family transcriptional regulator [Nakamurella alba]|uniref:TetR/AcrR family transcriptional regulator n=1 Tax=Nakamurella alba TaxID=2665158 RepID=UPI0018A9E5E5|nr:TetR/AcrR family transcriptional regulator [Nakamurella alba]
MTTRTRLAEAPDRAAPATPAVKPLRADARRNRDKVLAAAATAFTANGVDVSLEDIARQAGVGIGTLYRHFPTREALVLGVYRQQIDELDATSLRLLDELPPGEALREWMHAFVNYAAVKRGMVGLLKSMMETDSELFVDAKATLHAAANRLLNAARESGEIRPDFGGFGPPELLRAMGGVCMATDQPAAGPVAVALIDLIYDGLRYRAGS